MGKITEISVQKNNKNRCNIFIDGDFFIGVPTILVYSNSLTVGQEIDKNVLLELSEQKDRVESFDKALNYISKNLKTKKH